MENKEEHTKEEYSKALGELVSTTTGANVVLYDGEQLADEDEGSFYNEESNTIYLDVSSFDGSDSKMYELLRHENQHASDGLTQSEYEADKDEREYFAQKSQKEFLSAYEREFGTSPDETKSDYLTKLGIGTNGAENVEDRQPWPLQVGISGSGEAGSGRTGGVRVILGKNEETGEWQFGTYTIYGIGGLAGVECSAVLDFSYSNNNRFITS